SCFAACFRVSLCGAAAKKMTPSQESRFAQDLFLSCVYRLLLRRMFPGFSMRRSRKENDTIPRKPLCSGFVSFLRIPPPASPHVSGFYQAVQPQRKWPIPRKPLCSGFVSFLRIPPPALSHVSEFYQAVQPRKTPSFPPAFKNLTNYV
ncbi:MAG: hypothetical protein PUK79_09220, partial [Clostridiales bacterium]|nr:hypothetical protein [Clostridiales bacterium]